MSCDSCRIVDHAREQPCDFDEDLLDLAARPIAEERIVRISSVKGAAEYQNEQQRHVMYPTLTCNFIGPFRF